ncbi:MAG TPA: hypothetical protein VGP82_21990 [Ktedonobacterales bacterium]|nr:hypothetical protein [Ktedonobacterales bacterium]
MNWFVVSTWFFLICCAYALVAFGVRWLLRGATPRFDAIAELLGHPLHSLSMTYMLLVMLGLAPVFIASSLWIGCFLLCATFFGLRLLLNRARVGRHDAFGLLFALAMAYMWIDPRDWPPTLTAGICLICLVWICLALRRLKLPEALKYPARINKPVFLANSGHVALLTTMLALFLLMQPGHLITVPELTRTNATPCVEAMPGMHMCP